MKNNLIWKIMGITLVFVKSVQLECICIENKHQANCVLYRLNEMNVPSRQVNTLMIIDNCFLQYN